MAVPESSPEVKKEMANAVSGARRKALLAFLVAPIVFAAALAFIIYLATHWPYPPGFEWVSRWTPRQLFLLSLGVIALYLILCLIFFWRLAGRWLWDPTTRVLNIIEGIEDKDDLGSTGASGDMKQFLYRIERAVERHQSASDGTRELDDVRVSVERLCEDIEQMGVRHFDRDFSEGRGALEPLGKSLLNCCAELSGFMSGCVEVVTQIGGTLHKAQEKAGELASQTERAFVGHTELSVGAKGFTKRVEEALNIAGPESRGEFAYDRRDSEEAFQGFGQAVKECADAFDQVAGHDVASKEMSKDSKDLADEATVIALNAAIEASRSGSADLQTLADNARQLAERSMELAEKVDFLSTGYLEAVQRATAALDDLRVRLLAWREEAGSVDAKRADAAAGLTDFLSSVGDMAASFAEHVESVARMSENASSEGQAARRAIDEAFEEMESLKRRLGGQG